MSTVRESSNIAVTGSKIVSMFEPPESAKVAGGMPLGRHRPPAAAGEMSSVLTSGKESDGRDDAILWNYTLGELKKCNRKTKAFVNLADALNLSMEDLVVSEEENPEEMQV
ncbi:hypothetical protein ACLOJK_025393 [Asimina triloba]